MSTQDTSSTEVWPAKRAAEVSSRASSAPVILTTGLQIRDAAQNGATRTLISGKLSKLVTEYFIGLGYKVVFHPSSNSESRESTVISWDHAE